MRMPGIVTTVAGIPWSAGIQVLSASDRQPVVGSELEKSLIFPRRPTTGGRRFLCWRLTTG